MKKLPICLTIFLLMCTTLSFSQYVNYEVKVILDSVKNVKGTLQKVSEEGIAVQDYKGNYYIFKAKNTISFLALLAGVSKRFAPSIITKTENVTSSIKYI